MEHTLRRCFSVPARTEVETARIRPLEPAKRRKVTAMTALLVDPKLINYVLGALYAANASRCAVHGPDAAYWLGALIITVAATWGYARQ